ncbi:phospholipase D-like domain-containing protein [Anaerobranca gottschalkii]|uniref:Phosphatidylserine/phosphatidylglycerophosphate/cardiolipin synthase n=1 Tax=Anaerobranca gottschalkii DSM 13577 TaxID=1120990 RepID=A0A1H9YHZ9_9FIRM|nr:phospholipase D family protein [Anaerobranca gottschalkii]SES68650.1 Phosphatidylserine/phosphatidylglycerophosphate/cardiolipin synthase [Anaerobranca gottschalkii DSM 13577]
MTRGKIKKGIKGIGLFLALYFLYFLVFGVVIFNFISPKEIDYNYSIDRFFAEKPGQDLALLLEDGYQSGARKLSLIHNAQSTIDFSTYTFLGGDYTQIFIASLFQAADRGVKVRIIADGLFYNVLNHSRAISYGFMAHPNIEFKVYEPFNFLKPWVVNNRLHDKILIIDDKYAVIGGRNIGDKYVDLGPPEKFALDREVLLINTDKRNVENSVIQQFNQYFNLLWESEFAKNPRRSLTARRENKGREKMTELINFAQGKREVYPEFFAKDLSWLEEGIPTNRVTLIHNPLTRFNKQPQVWDQLTQLMEWGEERIFAQSPYVIPTRKMRNYLNLEGVNAEITILTNSLASTPNLPAFSGYTGYRKKIVDNVQEVYEYHGIGSIHGKTYVFDNRISVIGSFNLDPRSTFLSTETMVVIDSEEFTNYLMEELEKLVEQSLLVNSDYGYYYPEKAREVPASKRIKINILRILTYPFRHML